MKTIKITFLREKFELGFVKGEYAYNNNTYIGVVSPDGSLFTDLTVNLGFDFCLPENRAYIDTNNCDKSIIKRLEKKGLIVDTCSSVSRGFCVYPQYILTQEFLEDWCETVE